ncbi:hypothetical protein M569_06353 [Genlisea aurea]|uniref:Uncharacterized protein n=1 Tax=Genlisea aurea TaxID=192259 RepID=S8E7N2_9LAMI|nr:hypothetical protein M569_06353 [Genlisea aurea]
MYLRKSGGDGDRGRYQIFSRIHKETVQFRLRNDGESDDSGVCSPPLWTASPLRNQSEPLIDHRSLSPNSRRQAIVSGQKELMEMVKDLPESSYELSLKDLVEKQKKGIGCEEKGLFLKTLFPIFRFMFSESRSSGRRRRDGGKISPRPEPAKFSGSSGSDSSSIYSTGRHWNTIGFRNCWPRRKQK